MTAIQRFALHGTLMNPHSHGPYVRHEDHLAAMQGRCLAQIEEPAQQIAGYRISDPSDPTIKPWLSDTPDDNGYTSEPLYAGAAPAAVAGPAPAGWQLVPATPTREWIASVADGGYEDCDCASLIADILIHAPAAPALEAPAAPAVPDGWKLVPEVATREMCAAMLSFLKDGFSLTENGSRPMSALYADLLAAAPQAPAQEAPAAGLPKELARLADIMRDCGRLVSTSGNAEQILRAAASALAAAPQASAASSANERAAFEAWIKKDGGDLSTFGSGQNLHYNNSAVNNAWTGWSSRAAQAAPAAPAVDASFEDLISDWAHGDALDAEYYRTLSQAARDVLAERRRQVCAEGYEPEADAMYESGELARAAATYALLATGDDGWRVEDNWPWGMSTLKRAEPRRMLEKAGALILADMERIDRAAAAKKGGEV